MQNSRTTKRQPRLLFCSSHCYWDPSSGAALSTRALLELLAPRGWSCRVFSGPHLDFEQARCLAQLLRREQVVFEEKTITSGRVPFTLYRFQHGGALVQIFDSPLSQQFPAGARE